MNILDRIVEIKKAEMAAARAVNSLSEIRERALLQRPQSRPPFQKLFTTKKCLVAEIKPKSPSAGELISNSPLTVADIYARSQADCISVLTDHEYFGGSLQLLEEVRQRAPQPILRKEFIIDEYQIYETALSSASAFLLIAAILSETQIATFHALGKSLGLDTITEVHDKDDMRKALAAHVDLIGINNRDLKTLEISLATTESLMHMVPPSIPVISESGLATVGDVARVRDARVRGILVGTAILQSPDPALMISQFSSTLNSQ